MVLARRPEDVVQGRKTSKWVSRWRLGIWLGKTEVSDERLLFADGGGASSHASDTLDSEGDSERRATRGSDG